MISQPCFNIGHHVVSHVGVVYLWLEHTGFEQVQFFLQGLEAVRLGIVVVKGEIGQIRDLTETPARDDLREFRPNLSDFGRPQARF
jgi:hypothetical protein